MQIFVQSTDLHTVQLDDTCTLSHLKEMFSSEIPVEDQIITCGGELIPDDVILSQHLPENVTLGLTGRLLGGKVHGSLARAGKVKGQTPKVAKMEDKKKKRTGRCKRRIQYNRRFSTAVSAFGRKKGPNSNS